MANDKEKARTHNSMPEEGQYPLQVVHQFEGGHRLIVSNDKQSPYIAFFHTSGSHTVYWPNGTVDNFVVGNSSTYNKSGAVVTVDHSNDVKVSGHNKLHVSGGGHIEVAGDANIVVGGSTNLVGLGGMGAAINGNFYLAATGSFNVNSPAVNIKADAFALNAPNIGFEGEISHKGNITTTGVHKDKIGYHMG